MTLDFNERWYHVSYVYIQHCTNHFILWMSLTILVLFSHSSYSLTNLFYHRHHQQQSIHFTIHILFKWEKVPSTRYDACLENGLRGRQMHMYRKIEIFFAKYFKLLNLNIIFSHEQFLTTTPFSSSFQAYLIFSSAAEQNSELPWRCELKIIANSCKISYAWFVCDREPFVSNVMQMLISFLWKFSSFLLHHNKLSTKKNLLGDDDRKFCHRKCILITKCVVSLHADVTVCWWWWWWRWQWKWEQKY